MASVDHSLLWRSQRVRQPSAGSLFPPRTVFRSTDPDETRLAIAQVFSPHELYVVGSGSRLDAALEAWDIGKITIAYKRHGAEVIVRPDRLGSYYLVTVPVKGSTVSRCGRSEAESGPGSAVVLSPTHEPVMRYSVDCEQMSLRIDRSTLEHELSRMLGRDIEAPVLFDVAMGLSTREGRRWAATFQFVLDEIRQGATSLAHPVVQSRVEQLMIDRLLLAQPHNFSEQLETGHLPARPPTVRHALEIIETRAADPLTIPMLAELAGVSVRSLQQGFHDYLGTTPLAYLREVRLARARDDLLVAHREDGLSVTEIAYRWGFTHLARFSAYYKQRYGELPSQTIRRR